MLKCTYFKLFWKDDRHSGLQTMHGGVKLCAVSTVSWSSLAVRNAQSLCLIRSVRQA